MTESSPTRGFATRPGHAESRVRATERSINRTSNTELTVRLTIDVTPALRGRIKIAALQRGLILAVMLGALLDREFHDDSGAMP